MNTNLQISTMNNNHYNGFLKITQIADWKINFSQCISLTALLRSTNNFFEKKKKNRKKHNMLTQENIVFWIPATPPWFVIIIYTLWKWTAHSMKGTSIAIKHEETVWRKLCFLLQPSISLLLCFAVGVLKCFVNKLHMKILFCICFLFVSRVKHSEF